MPYQAGSENLPQNVKKMPKVEQEKWIKTFNSAFENYSKDDPKTAESKAFATANAAVKKNKEAHDHSETGEKCLMCEVMATATTFEELEAGEEAMKQADEMGKLAFQTENLVGNVMRSPEIQDKPSALSRVVDGLKKRLGSLGRKETGQPLTAGDRSIFWMTKDKAGDYRWFALVSNIFRDTDNPPEIFETKAHKEYVQYVDETGNYPELWLWHTPGTKSGKADMIDFSDGFLLASGTFDKGAEDVAEKLAKDKDLGVSHGFKYRYSNKEKGIIGYYRTYEISPLPKAKAANPWAGIEILTSEANMNKEKRQFLVDKLGEDRVKDLESRPAELSKALKDAGIEYKEVTEPDKVDNPALDTKEITEAAVKAVTESESFKGVLTLLEDLKAQKEKDTKTISDLQTAVTEMGEVIKELKKTDDEKIAEALSPRSKGTSISRASESKDNLVDPEKDKELEKSKAAPNWLGAALGGLKNTN